MLPLQSLERPREISTEEKVSQHTMISNLVFQGIVLLGTEPSAALWEHGLASIDMGKEGPNKFLESQQEQLLFLC